MIGFARKSPRLTRRIGRKTKGKVFVGLSGGVDSSVSAALLKKEGYDVQGVFIKIAIEGYPCPAAADRRSAMRAAAVLGIPFLELDLSKEYKEKVFDLSIKEFARGETPNPDALCNREIKFGLFFDFAMSRGADFVATGHYAQIKNGKLYAGEDGEKDQSYFLWAIPETHLKKILFPIGHMKKREVRARATSFHLPQATRPDSQGLCFLGDISIPDMLSKELTPKSGDVLDENGNMVGTHEGAVLYTLGQRHGFTLTENSEHTKPHFVIGKNIAKNTITISTNKFPGKRKHTYIKLRECNWVGEVPKEQLEARFRYRQTLIPVQVLNVGEVSNIELKEPHYAPLGQSLVLYKEGRMLGGGVIDAIYWEDNVHH